MSDAVRASLEERAPLRGLPPPVEANGGPVYRASKRTLDVVGSFVVLIVSLPILVVLAILISATSKGWPVYRQWRAGVGGKPFRVWKLRTMVRHADRADRGGDFCA